ncbi:MAG TPA: hypothetical protein VMH88_06695 [Gemmatimonadales bacterium]|nr:hypothetical protein [Gemmatimonadales bacterium]
METLPTKTAPTPTPPSPVEVDVIPTWRELADRFRDVMKDFIKEGKEIERELEPKLLPALRRLRSEIERLITKLEERTERPAPPKQG